MAAVSWADTQIPETRVATQSLPKVGFRKAIQLEVLVIRIEAKCCSKIPQHDYAAIALTLIRFDLADLPPTISDVPLKKSSHPT